MVKYPHPSLLLFIIKFIINYLKEETLKSPCSMATIALKNKNPYSFNQMFREKCV